jgi:hypothetical protein
MNGSDFDEIASNTRTTSNCASHPYRAQREIEAARTLMDSLEGLIDFSECPTDTVEVGSPPRSSIGGSCHASHIELSDGSCKRKHNLERDCSIKNDQHKSLKTKHARSSVNLKFACPFFQNDPSRFNRRQACSGPGFSSISRVK